MGGHFSISTHLHVEPQVDDLSIRDEVKDSHSGGDKQRPPKSCCEAVQLLVWGGVYDDAIVYQCR